MWRLGPILAALTASCTTSSTFEDMATARRLTAQLHADLLGSADASNRAVMAEDAAMSAAFAAEARRGRDHAREREDALRPLVARWSQPREIDALSSFDLHFAAYEEIDERILRLAGERTNRQATALAFDDAAAAADDLHRSLTPSQGRSAPLALAAELAVRTIEAAHAPHIAERDPARMSAMEAEMDALDAEAAAALDALGREGADIHHATDAFERFRAVHARIIALSRANTDVVSLDLALNDRLPLAIACAEDLTSLADALARRDVVASR